MTTSRETNTQIVARGYAAFSAGDLPTLSEVIAQDCTWVVGGQNALSGTYHGRDAVFDYFGRLLEVTHGAFQITVLTITEPVPDTVLITCHVMAAANGRTFDEEVVQQMHLRQGVVTGCRTFVENGHLWDALIGPAQIVLPTQAQRERVSRT